MTILEATEYMKVLAKFHPDARITFANNKVEVSKIVWDEKSQSVNIR